MKDIDIPTTPLGDHLRRIFLNDHTTVAAANWFFVLLFPILTWLAWKFSTSRPSEVASEEAGFSRRVNFFLVLLGALAGWGIGTLAVPYDASEKDVYSRIGAAVAAFLPEYLSKCDHFITASLADFSKLSRITIIRAALFIAALLLASVVVITNRVDCVSRQNAALQSKGGAH